MKIKKKKLKWNFRIFQYRLEIMKEANTCSQRRIWLIVVTVVIVFECLCGSGLAEAKKIQYGELLTNDNELFQLQADVAPPPAKAQPKPHSKVIEKLHAAVRKNASVSVASVKKTSTTVIVKKESSKAKSQRKSEKLVDKNKIIVNIVYANSNSTNQTGGSDPTRLVYPTSESLSVCDKVSCKSNEVRFVFRNLLK